MRSIVSFNWVRALLSSLILTFGLTSGRPALAGPPEAVLHTFNNYADDYGPEGLIQGSDGNFYGTTSSYRSYGTVFKISTDGTTFTTLHSFNGNDGDIPEDLIQGSDGNLYGTTQYGGANDVIHGGDGTVFKLSTDGTTFTTLYSFDGDDGASPLGLIQGSDGNLYGTTLGNDSGANGFGTVFKMSTSGTNFKTLHSFFYPDGTGPNEVIQGSDGNLYGITEYGGANDVIYGGDGTVFKISTDGTTFKTLHSFNEADGDDPNGLIQGSDGNLYGTTSDEFSDGESSGDGTVFKISTDGTTFTTLHSFDVTDGASPNGLIQGSDGNLYGTTIDGGTNNVGTVFKFSTDGTTFKTLHSFNETDGNCYSGLIQGSDGNLYGTSYAGGENRDGSVFSMSLDGTTFTTLFVFANGLEYGQYPLCGLTLGSDSDYYGTTLGGGTYGYGTVFKMSLDGANFKILHSFDETDGSHPATAVIQGKDGNLYGTTSQGGGYGDGTVFKMRLDGTNFTTLHRFDFYEIDGAYPNGLMQGSDGNLYGTTYAGGANNQGTVFKIIANGKTFTTLHGFDGFNGASPNGLIQGSDGNLYGTTFSGGENGDGTVFRITPSGTLTTLHDFTGYPSDGSNPGAIVIQAFDGYLYGTTFYGGEYGYGTVFQISTHIETFKILHSFNVTDGDYAAGVMQGSDGNLYGTTNEGGANGDGTIYELSRNGKTFTTLYNFAGSPTDGANSQANLLEGPDGNLYGTTKYGGIPSEPDLISGGTIFQLQTQLSPDAPLISSFTPAKVHLGASVTVTGLYLKNATSVTINGVVQKIISDAATSLTFKVTTGTTTGLIVVTTSKGSGSSLNRLVID